MPPAAAGVSQRKWSIYVPRTPGLFETQNERWADGPGGTLNPRERGLLTGALNVQALLQPAREFSVVVLRGARGDLPRLTGSRTGEATWPAGREFIGRLEVASRPWDSRVDEAGRGVVLDLGGPVRLEQSVPGVAFTGLRRSLRRRFPVLVDEIYQRDTDRIDRVLAKQGSPVSPPVMLRGAPERLKEAGRPKAILFGMYFLEIGGAEKWALATIEMASRRGFTPLVLVDQPSPHPLVEHPAMRDAVFLPITHAFCPGEDTELLENLFANFDVRLVHLHHCNWLYERLSWIRAARPGVTVVDSLHIHERRGGGFVELARKQSALVDVHHVVSPGLQRTLVDDFLIPERKVIMRPLLDLVGPAQSPVEGASRRDSARVVTVSFVGRLTQQKRPFLFVALAHRLSARGPGRFRFLLHGDGELEEQIRQQMDRLGLGSVVDHRHSDVPVSETYGDSDIVVSTSENEGLALVTIEAAQAGCLAVSTDVGAQCYVVPPPLLLPRHPISLLRHAERLLRWLSCDPVSMAQLRDVQRSLIAQLGEGQQAGVWVSELYASLAHEAT